MEYFIGEDEQGLFLFDKNDAEIVAKSSSPVIDVLAYLARPLMELKAIQTYLTEKGENAHPLARQDYEGKLQDLRRMEPLLSSHWKRNPLRLEQVTQEQIIGAYNKKDESFLFSLAYGLLV